jgi:hypothetical protein
MSKKPRKKFTCGEYEQDRQSFLFDNLWRKIIKLVSEDDKSTVIPVGIHIDHDPRGAYSTLVIESKCRGRRFDKVSQYLDIRYNTYTRKLSIHRSHRGPNYFHFYTDKTIRTKWSVGLDELVESHNERIMVESLIKE